jgi:hypothetical protein
MEIDALEQLINENVKVQGQIMRDGFRTCLMVFIIVAGVVAGVVTVVVTGVVTAGDEVYRTTTLLPVSSPEESALTSMRVDRFFLRVEEKTCHYMAGIAGVRQLDPCARVWLPPPG